MSAYFATPERTAQLLIEANKWPGTPFADYSAVPGRQGGASCGYMTLAVLEACGHFPSALTLPRVGWRENIGSTESTIERAFDRWTAAGLFESVNTSAPIQPGDVVGVRLGTTIDHVALALPHGLSLSIRIRQRAIVAQYQEPTVVKIWRPIDHAK